MSSGLPELLAQFDRQRGKGYSVGARLSDPIIAALRAEVTAWETAFAQRVTEQCATYRDEWEESEARARVAEQALTDAQARIDRTLATWDDPGCKLTIAAIFDLLRPAGGASTTREGQSNA